MDCLEYFSGGVPTGATFQSILEDLTQLSKQDAEPQGGIHRIQELCFIGLLSYFEAFCKDQFAALINIEPQLVSNLKAAGQNVEVDTSRLVIYSTDVQYHLGFVLAEKYDFGSSKKINGLFSALLKISPFSADEAATYDGMLRDRNLLVHHGGTYTFSYLEQIKPPMCEVNLQAFYNSRTVGASEVVMAIKFVEGIAKKIVHSSQSALVQYLKDSGIKYSGERLKALDMLEYWGV